MRIVKWAIDPALDGDPYADRPYLYSPGLASWNYLRIGEKKPQQLQQGGESPNNNSNYNSNINVHDLVVEEGADGSGKQDREKFHIPSDPAQRQKHFLDESARQKFVFEKDREYLVDFGNPYLGFSGESAAIKILPSHLNHIANAAVIFGAKISHFVFQGSISMLPSILMRGSTNYDIRSKTGKQIRRI